MMDQNGENCKLLSEVHTDAQTTSKDEMVEMISEYVDDASLISIQFSTKWKSIVMDDTSPTYL